MLDLQNLNLVELNAQEMQEVEGGIIWFFVIAALLVTSSAY